MQHLPASALQKEELERTKRFVRYRGEDLHNTWTEGNERAQVRVCERCPVPARDGAVRSGLCGRVLCPHRGCAGVCGCCAQARQAANLAVPTTQSVLGWWTATAKNRQPSGLNTCRVYQTQKNGQTSFIENEVSVRTHVRPRVLTAGAWLLQRESSAPPRGLCK
jgi:hypothetical protein